MEFKGNVGKNNNNGAKNKNGAIFTCGKTKEEVNDEFNRVLSGQPRVIGANVKPFYKPSEVDCHGFPLPQQKKTSTMQAEWLVRHVSNEGIYRD